MKIRQRLIMYQRGLTRKHLAWHLYRKTELATIKAWENRLDFCWYYPNLNIHLVGIPKTGCSSLKLLLLRLAMKDEHINQDPAPSLLAQRGIIDANCFRLLSIPNKTSFSFVRNPYERLVSCYRNKVRYYNTKGQLQMTINVPEDTRHSFEAFVRFACHLPDHLRENHFASQWFWLLPGLTRYRFIGRTEQLSEHTHLFFDEIGAPSSLLETIPRTEKNSSGHYSWKDYYTEELAHLVYQAYWPDFEAFGYHKDAWKKDCTTPNMAPIHHYDPACDIERFRAYFTVTEKTEA